MVLSQQYLEIHLWGSQEISTTPFLLETLNSKGFPWGSNNLCSSTESHEKLSSLPSSICGRGRLFSNVCFGFFVKSGDCGCVDVYLGHLFSLTALCVSFVLFCASVMPFLLLWFCHIVEIRCWDASRSIPIAQDSSEYLRFFVQPYES